MLPHTRLSSVSNCSPRSFIHTISLVDSGCTALAFADDEAIVNQYAIPTKPLLHPRPVRLADGSTMGSISQYFTMRTHIGDHVETLLFYVTRLSKTPPVILGIPWLKKHNPLCDWPQMRLVFNSPYCSQNCLPWRSCPGGHTVPLTYVAPAALPQPPRPLVTRQVTVTDVPEDPPAMKDDRFITEDWTTTPDTNPITPTAPANTSPATGLA